MNTRGQRDKGTRGRASHRGGEARGNTEKKGTREKKTRGQGDKGTREWLIRKLPFFDALNVNARYGMTSPISKTFPVPDSNVRAAEK